LKEKRMRYGSKPPRLLPGDLLKRSVFEVESGFALDVRWVLEQLAEDGDVRINCGFPVDSVDGKGRTWGKDRFFDGGTSSLGTTSCAPVVESAYRVLGGGYLHEGKGPKRLIAVIPGDDAD
jgi:hypothetical protein